MIGRKYVIHCAGVGIACILIIYATSCDSLPFSSIIQLARQYVNPACEVASYQIEVPEWPQNPHQPTPLQSEKVYGTPTSNTSIGLPMTYTVSHSTDALLRR